MVVACTQSRYIWGSAHDLAFLSNTGVLHGVADVLESEPWLLEGYAVHLDNPLDRNITVAVLKAHYAGEDINSAAALLLPPEYDLCERFSSHFDEEEIDDDGVWHIPMARCRVCCTLYDLSLIEPEVNGCEVEWHKEDSLELENSFAASHSEDESGVQALASIFDAEDAGGEQ